MYLNSYPTFIKNILTNPALFLFFNFLLFVFISFYLFFHIQGDKKNSFFSKEKSNKNKRRWQEETTKISTPLHNRLHWTAWPSQLCWLHWFFYFYSYPHFFKLPPRFPSLPFPSHYFHFSMFMGLIDPVREHYIGAYYILTFSISLSPSMVYEQLLVVSERSLVLHPCASPGRYHRLYIYFSLTYLLSRPRVVTQVFMYIR